MQMDQKTIGKLKSLKKPAIIAVSGFGGSGKSTLANQIAQLLHAPVICIDSFIKQDKPEIYKNWEIMDYDRFKDDVLMPFYKGQNPITFAHTRWDTDKEHHQISINHNGILVIEGVGLFQPTLMTYYSYSIWVDVPLEEAARRGKKRDRETYNRPQDEKWDGLWKDNDRQFYEKYQPNLLAKQVISNK
jgi:uridine kinase